MLSAVLHSETAVKVSIRIIEAFVEMRRFLLNNAHLIQKMEQVEVRQLRHIADTDEKFNQVFNALKGQPDEPPRQGIFYNGQIFDAYTFAASLIKQAKASIILVDNYVDESVLVMFSKRRPLYPLPSTRRKSAGSSNSISKNTTPNIRPSRLKSSLLATTVSSSSTDRTSTTLAHPSKTWASNVSPSPKWIPWLMKSSIACSFL